MQRCPTCETEYDESLSACPECAGAEEEVHHCPRCDEDYRGGRGCPACGALREPVPCALHPERSASGQCVVCGAALCEECASPGQMAFLCAEHRGVRMTEGWAEVYTTTSEFEAQLLRDNLRAEGIDAQTYSQRDRIFSVDLGELSIVRLLVPVWSYPEATEIIRSHMDTGGEVAFACPACGEAFEPGTSECQSCGGVLA
jgi:hypothetical protein